MNGGVGHLVLSGPLILAVPVAAAAGAVTFLSPCCLPLVPGYLSYGTGMSGAAAAGPGPPRPAHVPAGPPPRPILAGTALLVPGVAALVPPGARGVRRPAATSPRQR